eukprot:1157888-Pelagomonas_calceolata.AAC.9
MYAQLQCVCSAVKEQEWLPKTRPENSSWEAPTHPNNFHGILRLWHSQPWHARLKDARLLTRDFLYMHNVGAIGLITKQDTAAKPALARQA